MFQPFEKTMRLKQKPSPHHRSQPHKKITAKTGKLFIAKNKFPIPGTFLEQLASNTIRYAKKCLILFAGYLFI